MTKKVQNTLDLDGDLAQVQTKTAAGSYQNRASNFTYLSQGGVKSLMLGNNRWENAQYNNRLQITQIGMGTTSTDTSLLKIDYDYGTPTQNNGSLKQQTIAFSGYSGTMVQSYTYDNLNRIQSAQETYSGGLSWKETFSYDRFGNRRFDAANTTTIPGCAQANCNPTISQTDNRFDAGQGYLYDQTGNVLSRRDFMPFGEEAFIGIGNRAVGHGYTYGDSTRQKFTGYERDEETNLDFAEARMYSNLLGRFSTTDPIIMSQERVFDPQQINLYHYARNNPLAFTYPTGEEINEPTGLNDEDQNAYEKWKKKFLSTAEGRKTWAKYQNDKNFILNIAVSDRGSKDKNRGAKVDNFQFNKDGDFTGATMTLGRNLGKSLPNNTDNYIVLGHLSTSNSKDIGALKIAHEFGHLDDLRSRGKKFYEQQTIIDEDNAQSNKPKSVEERMNDPVLKEIGNRFQKKFGIAVLQVGVNRERRAEIRAVPTIRQIYGSIPSKAKKAVKKYGGN